MEGGGVIPSLGHRDGYARTPSAARAEPAPPVALRASPCTTGEPGVGAGLPDRGDDQRARTVRCARGLVRVTVGVEASVVSRSGESGHAYWMTVAGHGGVGGGVLSDRELALGWWGCHRLSVGSWAARQLLEVGGWRPADQWAIFGGLFPAHYGADEWLSGGTKHNHFERWAGLSGGCYTSERRLCQREILMEVTTMR